MRIFGRRAQKPTESRDVCSPSTACQDGAHGRTAYNCYTTVNCPPRQQATLAPSISQSPPPPYDAFDNGHGLSSTATYDAALYPRQYLPIAPGTPTSSAYASATTFDLARPKTAAGWAQEPAWQSTSAVAARLSSNGSNGCAVARGLNQGVAFCDRVTERLNDMLARPENPAAGVEEGEACISRDLAVVGEENVAGTKRPKVRARLALAEDRDQSSGSVINWQKTWLYQNSRLPPGMVPFNAYLPTWTLVCRAAKASLDVYTRPPRGQRKNFTDADPRQGTKATIIRSQTVDDRNLIIVAIRGSQFRYVDWAVNMALAPTEPIDFLADRGNACHAGFLECARAMVHPVVEQLKDLIQRDPSCAASSLLFTGHSAGGAVATLLYMHMITTSINSSELTEIAGMFKRIHCITFGTPPLSLLPLQKPNGTRHAKDVFLSFANEGDWIVRASRAYVASLAKALAAPASAAPGRPRLPERVSRQKLQGSDEAKPVATPLVQWPVPDAALSNAGRLVLLREKPKRKHYQVEAVQLTDAQLRGVFFGDPAMHAMVLYKQRVDELAFAAVSGEDTSVRPSLTFE